MKRTGLQRWLILLFIMAAASQALAWSPQDAQDAASFNDKGKAHLSAGRYKEAVEAFKQAVRLKPDDAEAHTNLGVAYRSLKRFDEAAASFKEAIRLKPDWAVPHIHLGITYLNTDRAKEAINSFKEAVRLEPKLAEAQNNLGVAYSNSQRPHDAIDPLKEAIKLQPGWAEPYNNLGIAYLKSGKYEEAVKNFTEAIRLKPDWAKAHYNLGAAYVQSGDRQKAVEQYEALKSMDAALAKSLNGLIEGKSRIVPGGVLNGKAISLPKPDYPSAAKVQRVSGTVSVQVTVDENGNVIAAKAISGHQLLQQAAVDAARRARFSPTKIEGNPVTVTGVIIYNFVAW